MAQPPASAGRERSAGRNTEEGADHEQQPTGFVRKIAAVAVFCAGHVAKNLQSAWYQLPQRTRAAIVGLLTTVILAMVVAIIVFASPGTSIASMVETFLMGALMLSIAVRLFQACLANRDPDGNGGDTAANRRMLRQLLRHGLGAAGGGRAALLLAAVDRDFNENDYQRLLALDENTPTQQLARATPHEVSALPEVRLPPDWRPPETLPHDQRSCSICLSAYEGGDTQRILPCFHRFHSVCVDRWLTQGRGECPVCKTSVRQGGGAGAAHVREDGDVSPTTLQAIEAAEAGRGEWGGLQGLPEHEVSDLVADFEGGAGGGSNSDEDHLGLGSA